MESPGAARSDLALAELRESDLCALGPLRENTIRAALDWHLCGDAAECDCTPCDPKALCASCRAGVATAVAAIESGGQTSCAAAWLLATAPASYSGRRALVRCPVIDAVMDVCAARLAIAGGAGGAGVAGGRDAICLFSRWTNPQYVERILQVAELTPELFAHLDRAFRLTRAPRGAYRAETLEELDDVVAGARELCAGDRDPGPRHVLAAWRARRVADASAALRAIAGTADVSRARVAAAYCQCVSAGAGPADVWHEEDDDDRYYPKRAVFSIIEAEAREGERALARAAAAAAQLFEPEDLCREVKEWAADHWGGNGRLFLKDLVVLARLAGSAPDAARAEMLDWVASVWYHAGGAVTPMVDAAVDAGRQEGPGRARAAIEVAHRQLGFGQCYYARCGPAALASALTLLFIRHAYYDRVTGDDDAGDVVDAGERDAGERDTGERDTGEPREPREPREYVAAIVECAEFMRDHAFAPWNIADELREILGMNAPAARSVKPARRVVVERLAAVFEEPPL